MHLAIYAPSSRRLAEGVNLISLGFLIKSVPAIELQPYYGTSYNDDSLASAAFSLGHKPHRRADALRGSGIDRPVSYSTSRVGESNREGSRILNYSVKFLTNSKIEYSQAFVLTRRSTPLESDRK